MLHSTSNSVIHSVNLPDLPTNRSSRSAISNKNTNTSSRLSLPKPLNNQEYTPVLQMYDSHRAIPTMKYKANAAIVGHDANGDTSSMSIHNNKYNSANNNYLEIKHYLKNGPTNADGNSQVDNTHMMPRAHSLLDIQYSQLNESNNKPINENMTSLHDNAQKSVDKIVETTNNIVLNGSTEMDSSYLIGSSAKKKVRSNSKINSINSS